MNVSKLCNVTFTDVVGLDDVKKVLQDQVNYLKNSKEYGRASPKGVLLVGNPGSGKTHLARAVAGEASVKLIHATSFGGKLSHDELFKEAKNQAPCVLFIDDKLLHRKDDELDLDINKIHPIDGVIVIGATEENSNQINEHFVKWCSFNTTIDMHAPDVRARKEIFEHYLKEFGKAENYNTNDINVLVKNTSGFGFIDLTNIIEYAVFASFNDTKITNDHFERARQKIICNRFHRIVLPNQKSKMCRAYHEAAHAIICYYTPNTPELNEVTILSGVGFGGFTSYKQDEGQAAGTKSELLAMIDISIGGLVGETLIFGLDGLTNGPEDDMKKVKRIAKTIVDINHLDKPYPDDEKIKSEMKKLLAESHDRTKSILEKYAKGYKALAEALIERELLKGKDVMLVLTEAENDPLSAI